MTMETETKPKRGDSLFHEHDGYERHAIGVRDHDTYFARKAAGIDTSKKSKGKRTRAPKRGGAPAKARGLSPRDQVWQSIQMINTVALMIPPIAEGALDEVEATLLCDAIDAELTAHPEWRVWFERMSQASPHLMLFQAVAGILLVRLARRGLLPIPEGAIEAMQSAEGVTPNEQPDPTSLHMETRRTPGPDRGYGIGEVNDGSAHPTGAQASADPSLEAG